MTATPTLTVLYDADCGICSQMSRAMLHFDTNELLKVTPLQTAHLPGQPARAELERTLNVVDVSGNWSTGGRAVVEIARRLPAMWPVVAVARLPGAVAVLEVGYWVFAANRHRFSRLLGFKVCAVPSRRRSVGDDLHALDGHQSVAQHRIDLGQHGT